MVAWQDNGIPTSDILYRFFKISLVDPFPFAGPDYFGVTWRTDAKVLQFGGGNVGGLSAGYIDDHFFIAWAQPDGGVQYTRTKSLGDYDIWLSPSTVTGAEDVVGVPNWLYSSNPNKEGGLVWTSIP
jgi:hypothetical protein